MTTRRRVMVVYGTRPEAIKLAPVVQELRAAGRHDVSVVVTGQHREMLDQVNEAFGIVPDHDLALMAHGQGLPSLTASALLGLTELISEIGPDVVVVQGDTTTTLAASMAAFYARVPVLHVEAGLRTGDLDSPYPEEMNRRVTTRLSARHAAPTERARHALLAEGVPDHDIEVTGNTIVDALTRTLATAGGDLRLDAELAPVVEHGGRERPIVIATMHRRESWGTGMADIAESLRELAIAEPGALFVVPIHRNPIVRDEVLPRIKDVPNVLVLEPLAYLPFVRLLSHARLVLTDSGGIQEEAPALDVPVLVMRETTERAEAIDTGAARLVGTRRADIVGSALELLRDDEAHRRMAQAPNPFGDGRASGRIVRAIDEMLEAGLDLGFGLDAAESATA